MKIILLGGTGLAGQAIQSELLNQGATLKTVARENADINIDVSDSDNLSKLLHNESPDLVINAAALIDIDKCNKDYHYSWNINCRVPSIINDWSICNSLPYMHISTDHFFSGDGNHPHLETDKVSLLNEYAKQKYAAESICLTSKHSLILRTSIIGFRGWQTKTFAEWVFDAVIHDKEIIMFDDAWTSSLDVYTFAKASISLLTQNEVRGLYNLGSSEVYSKADFIKEVASQLNIRLTRARIGSIQEHMPNRASSLGLNIKKAQSKLDWKLPNLKSVVSNLIQRSNNE